MYKTWLFSLDVTVDIKASAVSLFVLNLIRSSMDLLRSISLHLAYVLEL